VLGLGSDCPYGLLRGRVNLLGLHADSMWTPSTFTQVKWDDRICSDCSESVQSPSSPHGLHTEYVGECKDLLLSAFLDTVLPLFFYIFFYRNLIYMKEIYTLSIFRMSDKAVE